MVRALLLYLCIDYRLETDSWPILVCLNDKMLTLAGQPYSQGAHTVSLFILKGMDLAALLENAFSFLRQRRLMVL
jgi:hypothetical protein